MYCTHCGIQIGDDARYCQNCGTLTSRGASTGASTGARPAAARALSRSREGAKIAGVCAGVARYFGLEVSLVRILWIVLTIYPPGVGLLAYIICWIVMPRDPLPPHAAMDTVSSM
jgi:phage shock protein C